MFPFLWIGAIFAALFLTAVLAVFALLAKVLDVTGEAGSSIVPGLVSGFRDWTKDRGALVNRIGSPRSADPGTPIEEPPDKAIPLQRLHPRVR